MRISRPASGAGNRGSGPLPVTDAARSRGRWSEQSQCYQGRGGPLLAGTRAGPRYPESRIAAGPTEESGRPAWHLEPAATATALAGALHNPPAPRGHRDFGPTLGRRCATEAFVDVSFLTFSSILPTVGIVLPIILIIGEAFFLSGGGRVRGSLSAYYHTSTRDIFVAGLCVTGFRRMLTDPAATRRENSGLDPWKALGLRNPQHRRSREHPRTGDLVGPIPQAQVELHRGTGEHGLGPLGPTRGRNDRPVADPKRPSMTGVVGPDQHGTARRRAAGPCLG